MQIALLEVAKYYSHEKMILEVQGITSFVFHKWEGTNVQYPNLIRESCTKCMKKSIRKVIERGFSRKRD